MTSRASSTAKKSGRRCWPGGVVCSGFASARRQLAGTVLALAIVLGITAGCNGVAPTPATARVSGRGLHQAQLTILNQSGCRWRIAVTPAPGGETRAWQVAPAASLDAAVPAGDYLVEQTMLGEKGEAEATRSFPMHIEAGQTYRWRLVTLLSP